MTKKVLVISSNRLGDCILSSGINRFLKNKFKDAKFFLFVVLFQVIFSNFVKILINLSFLKKEIFFTLVLSLEANMF